MVEVPVVEVVEMVREVAVMEAQQVDKKLSERWEFCIHVSPPFCFLTQTKVFTCGPTTVRTETPTSKKFHERRVSEICDCGAFICVFQV